ncbi:MAG: polysaccharide biosynthesis C-terminal domain-containing protein [Anaerolineales bacterium]|nr:polysaccharide biosynthesis C-terminal domain-containing protein [Anaerolineales bacterium]
MPAIADRIRRHLADPHSEHRKIALGFVWVGLFVFIGKLAGAAKEITIAWRYGVSETVDAYVFILNLVNWPVAVWFSVLTVVLVPLTARLRHDAPGELPRFRAELLGLALLIGVGLGLLAWLGLPILLRAGWLGLSGTALSEALQMAGGLSLLVPMGTVISLFSAWLLAAGHHRNTLFEAIPAFALLVALLLPPAWLPEPLLWGTVTGFALHMSALGLPLHRRGALPPPTFRQRSPAWTAFWGGFGVMSVGQVLTTSTNLIDQLFAAGLGEGALASLSYAGRILALLLGLGAIAVGRATLPVFSAANEGGEARVTALALRWAMLMLAAGSVALLVAWPLAPWGVSLLLERGAFTTRDTREVTMLFRLMALQLPFYFSALVLVSALAAQRRHRWIAVSGGANLLSKVPLALWLVPLYGIQGLVLSTVIMYAVSAALLLLFVVRPSRARF